MIVLGAGLWLMASEVATALWLGRILHSHHRPSVAAVAWFTAAAVLLGVVFIIAAVMQLLRKEDSRPSY